MNKIRISLVLITLVVMALTGIHAQTASAPNWTTMTSESDEKNSMLYQAQSDFSGKHYESQIYGRDLEKVEKWKVGKELPTSLSKIITNAQNAFNKQFPQFSQFKLVSVNLVHLPLVDDWIVNVEFNGTDFGAPNPSTIEDKKINILVLLNGSVVTPTETAK